MADADDDDPPRIRDHPGRWDEALSGLVVVSPFVVVLAAVATGDIDPMALLRPLALPAGALLAGTYLLFVMKFFGAAPVSFVLDLLDGYQRDR